MPKSKLADALAPGRTLAEMVAEASPEELLALGLTPAAQAAAIIQKRQASHPKKKVTTRKVKKVFDASLVHPPVGFRWCYNRLDHAFEGMFNGMVYAFDEHEYRLLTVDVAKFLWTASVISYDPTKTRGVRALALDPFSDEMMEPDESKGFGEPLVDPKQAELLDRTNNPNPTGKSAGPGVTTKVALLGIGATVGGTNLPRP
jgi:hypothetical protein